MAIPTMPFGRTGYESTRIIFGAAALARGNPEDSQQALELVIKYGINHIDTAASYGRAERLLNPWFPEHRERFFLATKTGERTYEGAKAQIAKSLERMGVDSVDLIQLHNLVAEDEWAVAMGPHGALQAAIEAREQGLVRFIGVTGHGVTVAAMHLRSLERFAFDSVLLPYNPVMMRNLGYAADFEELSRLCQERGVAHQTIKAITLGPWAEAQERTHGTWYEPLSDPADIAVAVNWVLGRPGVFLNTVGDLSLLPHVLEAASNLGGRPGGPEMDGLMERRAMAPLFV